MKGSAVLFTALLSLATALSPAAADIGKPSGAVVLTVAGNIANTNRPAYDQRRDVLFKFHEYTFDRAFAFDRAMLERLGVARVHIEYEGWAGPMTFTGPRLANVLKAVGCRSGPLVTLAVDGFSHEISRAEVEAREWVVATRIDGRPLGIGDRGPLWLVFDPPGERAATEDEENMWPWALFFIQCI